jgi:hypothetical protein
VASKIALHAILGVRKHVVMRVIIARPIVVIDGLLAVVVGKDPVVADVVPLFNDAGGPRCHISDINLSIPAVERAVVSALATGVEQHVERYVVAATEAIVEVDTSTRTVEESRNRSHNKSETVIHRSNLRAETTVGRTCSP